MKPEWSWRHSQPAVIEYTVAVSLVAAAAIFTALLRKLFPPIPNSFFFCAVLLSAWRGGFGPGLLASILSSATIVFCLPPPSLTGPNAWSEVPRFVLFLLVSFFISRFCKWQKGAQAALRKARDELEQRVNERTRELTAANEELKIEIAGRKRTETLLEGQKQVLEMIATDAPLPESLDALVRLIEAYVPGMLGSILLIDEQGLHLHHGAAPSLPPQYLAAIDGVAIGPDVGSCGTAAYLKEPVIVENIATDPRWKNHRAVALPLELLACWSTPIFDGQRRLLGTFAMYYRHPARPEPEHFRLIEMATHIAAIAIGRHHFQTKLRDSEAKLKEAERIADLGYWERDLAADRITWSEGTCRIFGLEPQNRTLSQAQLQELIHPDDRPLQIQAFADALEGKSLYDVEYRIIRLDGGIRFVHVRDEIEYEPSGKPIRMFGTVQDITERKKTEELLRRMSQQKEMILNSAGEGIWGLDAAGNATFINPAAAGILGYEPAELIGRNTHTTLHHSMADKQPHPIGKCPIYLALHDGLIHRSDEDVFWRKDGTSIPVQYVCNPMVENGKVIGAVVVFSDITERKRAEQAVQESQQLLQQVLATLPVGVAVTNQSGDIILANEASRHIWGELILAARERWAQSKGFWHDTGERIAPADWASVRALTKGETTVNELIDIETSDGRQKIILNSTAPIRNAEGRVTGAVIVNEDVTEQKKNEEKLRHIEEELARVARVTVMGELAASIAHEVNQPLAAVVTSANAASRWLARSPPNLDEVRKAVQNIARDGTRASEVIRRIRALIKKREPDRKSVNLNEVARETIALVQPELKRKKIALQLALSPDLPAAVVDRVQLQQVLLNLIVNAMDSLSAVVDRPRQLHVRTDRPATDAIQITVQDNGLGVKSEDTGRLFQPFYSTKSEGLGMGLAISRSIVEAHGGHLWTAAKAGPGATFQFTLPVQNGGES